MPRRKRSISGRTMIFGFVSGLTIFVWGLEGVWAGHMISTTSDDTLNHHRPVVRYNHKSYYVVLAESRPNCRQICDGRLTYCLRMIDKRATDRHCKEEHRQCTVNCQSHG